MHLLFQRHCIASLQFAISCMIGFSNKLGYRKMASKGDTGGQILLNLLNLFK